MAAHARRARGITVCLITLLPLRIAPGPESLRSLSLSKRYTSDAYRKSKSDLERAYSDLKLAEKLNPFSDPPLLARVRLPLMRMTGSVRSTPSTTRLSASRTNRPRITSSGLLLARCDRAAAQQELAPAAELNPQSAGMRDALVRLKDPVVE